ncbi:MAG: hypothetical protein KGL92_09445 [Gammaproteobacteria bacterium]|nr:hypothetical protein [Gammaproteobacteria bacterium]
MSSVPCAIERFSDAAICPDLWEEALDDLAGAAQSAGATLVLQRTTPQSIAVSASVRPFVDDYMNFPIGDPREARVQPRLDQGFLTDADHFTREEIARDPYYQEFLRPRGFGWNAAAALSESLVISVKRGAPRGPYDSVDLAALNAMLPGLRAVSRIATFAWYSRFHGQLDAFARIGRAALVLDRRERVLAGNSIVPFGDGLDLISGRLRAAHADDQRRLQVFLGALATGGASDEAGHAPILIKRPSGARPLLVDGIASREALRGLHSDAVAMLLITDLQRPVAANTDALVRHFDLTPTEARLAAAIGGGASLREAAGRLGISEAHARQRLKAIFHKTGTRRQSELALLITRIP